MQHLDNDMDDLFRKAAELYPLKTGIEKRYDEAPFTSAAIPAMATTLKHKHNRLLISLVVFFIILSIATVSYLNYQPASQNTSSHTAGAVKQIRPEKQGTISSFYQAAAVTARKKEIITAVTITPKQKNKIQAVNAALSVNTAESKKINREDGNYVNPAINTDLHGHESTMSPVLMNTALQNILPANNIFIAAPVRSSTASLSAIKPGSSVRHRTNAFYFGLETGLQWNQVKGQGFAKTGFSAGLKAGLQINRKFSFETGIVWSEKHFFSDGKYFDMTKAGMPSNMQLMSLSGSSNIIEVPFAIKYNILQHSSSGWFITTGLSSYILTKESNDYLAIINGQQHNQQGQYTAHKEYFSAAAQFGLGYQFTAGKQIKLSIEPYIQIPLKGIGIGEVQVMTTGLHIGISPNTRR